MEWNCPHCGAALSLTDSKIGTEWSFARCYRCGKDSLIRKQAVQILKVDAAPVGTSVLLPSDPQALRHLKTPSKPITPQKTQTKTLEVKRPKSTLWAVVPLSLGVALVITGSIVIQKSARVARLATKTEIVKPVPHAAAQPPKTIQTDQIQKSATAPVRAKHKSYLRTGPGSTYPIIETLAESEPTVILDRRGQWLKVKKADRVGWVASRDLIQPAPSAAH